MIGKFYGILRTEYQKGQRNNFQWLSVKRFFYWRFHNEVQSNFHRIFGQLHAEEMLRIQNFSTPEHVGLTWFLASSHSALAE